MSIVIKKIKTIQINPDGSFFFFNYSFLKKLTQLHYNKNDFKYLHIYDNVAKNNKFYISKQELHRNTKYRQKFL